TRSGKPWTPPLLWATTEFSARPRVRSIRRPGRTGQRPSARSGLRRATSRASGEPATRSTPPTSSTQRAIWWPVRPRDGFASGVSGTRRRDEPATVLPIHPAFPEAQTPAKPVEVRLQQFYVRIGTVRGGEGREPLEDRVQDL